MDTITCFTIFLLFVSCLALPPKPTIVNSYKYEVPDSYPPIKPVPIYGVPSPVLKPYPPAPVKPAVVYGVPNEHKLEGGVVSIYKYNLPEAPSKPSEIYGVPSKPVKPAEVYGVPDKVIVKDGGPITSHYEYILVDKPIETVVHKPHHVYGPPKPVNVYEYEEAKPVKPATVYGVPDKVVVKDAGPITSHYEYILADKPVETIVHKPHDVYGPPKVIVEPSIPIKHAKYEESVAPVVTVHEIPKIDFKPAEVPCITHPYPPTKPHVVKPYPPSKPHVVKPYPPAKPPVVIKETSKPIVSTYEYALPETKVYVKPQETYGVPHAKYGVPYY